MRTKIIILILSLTIGNSYAGISPQKAITVAETYYRSNTNYTNAVGKIYSTDKDNNGDTLYYIVDMDKSGFVIVSGTAVTHPIIGISTHGNYKSIPKSGVEDYLYNLHNHIAKLYQLNIAAQKDITTEWDQLSSGTPLINSRTSSVAPLLTITWNQSPYYNNYCPGGSVTGCVATAMSQIMKYWNYPASGKGSYSYSDSPYGTLSASFDSTINWSIMPAALTSSTPIAQTDAVASLIYKVGVSVAMSYSPTGSGAYVLQSENPGGPCAQYSYVNYFGYNSSTIQGLVQANYTTTKWDSILNVELNNSRPVEYVGYGSEGGHTWVVDGYNTSGLYDMNWGWGGEDDGYFALNNLDPSGIPLGSENAMLIGIEPSATQTCSIPTSLATSNITTSGATISWVGSGSPLSYTLNYKLSTASSWTSVKGITAQSYSLNSLTAGATYDVEVQQICSSSETSSFTSSVTFTTTQGACNTPTSLAASSITSAGATISWVGSGSPLSYTLNYQASGAGSWTSVTGITSESYSLTGLTAETSYNIEVQQVCSSSESSSFTSTVNFNTSAPSYCTSSGTSTSEYIKSVALGSINNTVSNDGGYGNYTSLSTTITAGTAYKITLIPGFASTAYSEDWTIYVDYTHNGNFVLVKEGKGTGSITGSITIPTTVLNGSTRMRVIMHRSSYVTKGCGSFAEGDVQDYTIVVNDGAASEGITLQPGEDDTTAANSMENIGNGLLVNVYPNPTSSTLYLKYLNDVGVTDMKLVDATGKILMRSPSRLDVVDVSKYAQGWYILVITGADGSVFKKMVMVSR